MRVSTTGIILATVESAVFTIPQYQLPAATGIAVVGHCILIPHNGSLNILHMLFALLFGNLVGRKEKCIDLMHHFRCQEFGFVGANGAP